MHQKPDGPFARRLQQNGVHPGDMIGHQEATDGRQVLDSTDVEAIDHAHEQFGEFQREALLKHGTPKINRETVPGRAESFQ